jgi:hypothetical protein
MLEKVKALPMPVKVIGGAVLITGVIWAGMKIYQKMKK